MRALCTLRKLVSIATALHAEMVQLSGRWASLDDLHWLLLMQVSEAWQGSAEEAWHRSKWLRKRGMAVSGWRKRRTTASSWREWSETDSFALAD